MSENDFISTLNQFKEFLDLQKEKGIPDIQMKILLRARIREVARSLNEFLINTDFSEERRLNLTIESLNILMEIYHGLPKKELFDIPRIKFSAYANFMRSNLVNQHKYSNIARNYSSATILSDLLIEDIIHFEELPLLPSHRDPDKFNREFAPIFNVLLSTTGIYKALLTSLPIIYKENLLDWSEKSIQMFKLFMELQEGYPIIPMLRTKKIEDYQKFVDNLFIMANSMTELYDLIEIIFLRFGDNIPPDLLPNELIAKEGKHKMVQIISKIKSINSRIEEQLILAGEKRLLPPNDDYKDSKYYIHYQFSFPYLDFKTKIVELYGSGLFGNEKELKQILKRARSILSLFYNSMGGKQKALSGMGIGFVLEHIKDVLPLISILSIRENNKSIFEDYMSEWEDIITKFSFEKDNDLGVLVTLCKLFVYTHLQIDIDFSKYYRKLDELIPQLQLRPRHLISFKLLKLVIGLYAGKPLASNQNIINEILEQESFKSEKSEYRENVIGYIDYLKEPNIGTDVLEHRAKIIVNDPHSWLIPDFSNYKSIDGQNYRYFPFNRFKDAIVE